ncbi:MAG: hypothetical protein LBQ68_09205, partial [Clostridiales bacterium]|nr:hypothetical protein [Clostridiales bacterium]
MGIDRVLKVKNTDGTMTGILQAGAGNYRKFDTNALSSIFGTRIDFSKIDSYGRANDGRGGIDNKWFSGGSAGDGFIDTAEIREFIHQTAGKDGDFDFDDFKKVFGQDKTQEDFDDFQNFVKVTQKTADGEFSLDGKNYTVVRGENKEFTILHNEANSDDNNILTYTEFSNGTKIFEQIQDDQDRLTSLREFNSDSGQLDIGYNLSYNEAGQLVSITKIAQNTETADTADQVAEHYKFETPIDMSEEISIDYINSLIEDSSKLAHVHYDDNGDGIYNINESILTENANSVTESIIIADGTSEGAADAVKYTYDDEDNITEVRYFLSSQNRINQNHPNTGIAGNYSSVVIPVDDITALNRPTNPDAITDGQVVITPSNIAGAVERQQLINADGNLIYDSYIDEDGTELRGVAHQYDGDTTRTSTFDNLGRVVEFRVQTGENTEEMVTFNYNDNSNIPSSRTTKTSDSIVVEDYDSAGRVT